MAKGILETTAMSHFKPESETSKLSKAPVVQKYQPALKIKKISIALT